MSAKFTVSQYHVFCKWIAMNESLPNRVQSAIDETISDCLVIGMDDAMIDAMVRRYEMVGTSLS